MKKQLRDFLGDRQIARAAKCDLHIALDAADPGAAAYAIVALTMPDGRTCGLPASLAQASAWLRQALAQVQAAQLKHALLIPPKNGAAR